MQPGERRPWPVLLLTALGAWLAAIPLLGVLGLLLGDVLGKGIGPYVAGVGLVAAAVVVLRGRGVPIFFEQLAIPALVVGIGALGMGLGNDLPEQAASAVLCAVVLALARAIPHAWLRVLLGAAAAVLAIMVLVPRSRFGGSFSGAWLGLHVALAIWFGAMWRAGGDYIENVAAGWILAVLGGLAVWSGMAFLVAGLAPAPRDATSREVAGIGMQGASALLTLAAAAFLRRREPPVLLAGAVLAALSWFMPALGAVSLVQAWAVTRRRWRLAAAAALAGLWIIGSFYYRLQWPLATKAVVLAGAGALLALAAWISLRKAAAVERTAPPRPAAAAWIALSALATLGFANYAIRDMEDLIARGEKVFVELAPVDPRSLAQGDYMRLDYRLPGNVEGLGSLRTAGRPYVVLERDARGVAQPVRIDFGRESLQPGEIAVRLTPKDGRWTLVTDAWFFREGDDRRWQAAKYGEFRVMPDGRALLVGLADAQLRTIAAD